MHRFDKDVEARQCLALTIGGRNGAFFAGAPGTISLSALAAFHRDNGNGIATGVY
jgi:peptidoglycan hydrolase-like protein with peptidoglycan-binding domain